MYFVEITSFPICEWSLQLCFQTELTKLTQIEKHRMLLTQKCRVIQVFPSARASSVSAAHTTEVEVAGQKFFLLRKAFVAAVLTEYYDHSIESYLT